MDYNEILWKGPRWYNKELNFCGNLGLLRLQIEQKQWPLVKKLKQIPKFPNFEHMLLIYSCKKVQIATKM